MSLSATLTPSGGTRILAPDGTLPDGYRPALAPAALLDAFRLMLLSRRVDERAFSLNRQGRIGTFSPVHGQEAAVVGSALALDPRRDWIVPQYRELPAMLRHGYTLERFFLYFIGNPRGQPHAGRRQAPALPDLARHPAPARGRARVGPRHQGLDGVVCTYFGDGASSEGDFHEALNLAGVRRAPVIFLLQNNGWAISTPLRLQRPPRAWPSAPPAMASRASGSTATTSSPCTRRPAAPWSARGGARGRR